MESVSPVKTPQSPTTPRSCGSSSPCASEASLSTATGRRQSAEKRQFLMRMHLMDARTPSTSAPSTCTDNTEGRSERVNARAATSRWLYVDMLDWMGDIMSAPTGRICCPSSVCGVELGGWTWEQSEAVGAKAPTGPPVIRLDKKLIKTTSCMLSHVDSRPSLSRDNTPKSSPKAGATPANSTALTLPKMPPLEATVVPDSLVLETV